MTEGFSLTLGDQSSAASTVLDSREVLSTDLGVFTSSLETHISGITGKAISTLATCVNVWSESFKVFYEDLQSYAQALTTVDSTTAATEQHIQNTFINPDLIARMGD